MTVQYEKLNGEAIVKKYCSTRNPMLKEQAVHSFLPLVKHILGRVNLGNQSSLTREDLYQFGVVGLLAALERFDPSNGSSFKTFAYRRIHGEIIDAIRREGTLNRGQIKKLNEINQVKESLIKTLNREPSLSEIQEESSLSVNEISTVLSDSQSAYKVSLDDKVASNNEESHSYYDVIKDEDGLSPEEEMDETGLRYELKNLIQDLPERDRLVLALYYYEELTLADIGTVLNLSEGRVSQILNQVQATLRQIIKR